MKTKRKMPKPIRYFIAIETVFIVFCLIIIGIQFYMIHKGVSGAGTYKEYINYLKHYIPFAFTVSTGGIMIICLFVGLDEIKKYQSVGHLPADFFKQVLTK